MNFERQMAAPIKKMREFFHFNANRSYAYFIMDGDTMLFRGCIKDKNPIAG